MQFFKEYINYNVDIWKKLVAQHIRIYVTRVNLGSGNKKSHENKKRASGPIFMSSAMNNLELSLH